MVTDGSDPVPPKTSDDSGAIGPQVLNKAPRREARRNVELPAIALLANGSAESVTVLDLSYEGCKIECTVALQPGAELNLSVLGLGKMLAFVRWCSGGHAGLSFRAEPVEAPAKTPRLGERTDLKAMILLRRHGRQNFLVEALNVSASGCRVEFVDRPSVGERQWVKFDSLEAIEAEVRWLEGSSAGLEFLRPIHPAVFDLLAAKLN